MKNNTVSYEIVGSGDGVAIRYTLIMFHINLKLNFIRTYGIYKLPIPRL